MSRKLLKAALQVTVPELVGFAALKIKIVGRDLKMSKKVPLYWVLICTVLAAIIAFNASYIAVGSKYNRAMDEAIKGQAYNDLYTIERIVKNNYAGELDPEALKNAVLKGYVAGIGDKYAAYMTAEQFAEYTASDGGNAVGIGINVVYSYTQAAIEIIDVYPDSPAEKAGLVKGDFITAVDAQSVSEESYYTVIDLIKGEQGSTVKLSILRGEVLKEIECVRDRIKTYSVDYHIYRGTTDIGVIRISEFNSTTPTQFRDAIQSLKESGCDSFVFDVRNNPGGDLESVCGVLDYLLPEGPIIHIYYADGSEQHRNSDASCFDMPCTVLVNDVTASAAELFAAALRDYTRNGDFKASVMGTKTYGKGVLQSIYQLTDGSALKITTAHYNPPYSENYDGKGIIPDELVELSEEASGINFYKLDDYNDNQLIAACERLLK